MSNAETQIQKEAKSKSGKKYIGKFDRDKVVYVIQVIDHDGQKKEKKVHADHPDAKKKVIKDTRTQLKLAVGGKRIVVIKKDEEISEKEYNLLSAVAQKEYIKIV